MTLDGATLPDSMLDSLKPYSIGKQRYVSGLKGLRNQRINPDFRH
jgi:hypothetical protein